MRRRGGRRRGRGRSRTYRRPKSYRGGIRL